MTRKYIIQVSIIYYFLIFPQIFLPTHENIYPSEDHRETIYHAESDPVSSEDISDMDIRRSEEFRDDAKYSIPYEKDR